MACHKIESFSLSNIPPIQTHPKPWVNHHIPMQHMKVTISDPIFPMLSPCFPYNVPIFRLGVLPCIPVDLGLSGGCGATSPHACTGGAAQER